MNSAGIYIEKGAWTKESGVRSFMLLYNMYNTCMQAAGGCFAFDSNFQMLVLNCVFQVLHCASLFLGVLSVLWVVRVGFLASAGASALFSVELGWVTHLVVRSWGGLEAPPILIVYCILNELINRFTY